MNQEAISQTRSRVQKLKGAFEQLHKSLTENEDTLSELKRLKRNIESAQLIVQEVATKTQQELSKRISDIVTSALAAVYDDPYEFKIKYDSKRGRTEARLLIVDGENEIEPMGSSGGGVVDTISFALRIALWNLTSPKVSNTIILDEPFRFLGSLQEEAGKLLKMLSEKLGIQFIVVSHDDAIIENADKKFRVVKKKKVSSVIKID